MTVQMYDADERVTAEEALLTLLKVLPDTMVLLGGWAVYHLVNASYTREHGIPYLGSRDIDVGFHVDPSWTDDELRSSPFAKAIEVADSHCPAPHNMNCPVYVILRACDGTSHSVRNGR